MEIEGIELCKPIVELLEFLRDNDFTIIEERISDYHFHEVFIKMKNNSSKRFDSIGIDNITQPNPDVFCCSCHWSCVAIE